MKDTDANDPLNEKAFDEQKPENQNKEPVIEENVTPPEKEVQEHTEKSPVEESVAESPTPEPPESEIPEPEPPTPSEADNTDPASTEPEPPTPSEADNTDPASTEPEPPTPSEADETDPASTEPAPAIAEAKQASRLIDDHEEQRNNAVDEDDVEHVDNDKQNEHEERINYSLLSKEDLVKLLREKLDNPGKGNIRKDVEEIRQAFNDKYNTAIEEKKQHFLGEGGNVEDFKPADDPLNSEMKELLNKFRSLKAEFTRQLEKTKQENLIKKQEILEELRMLMESQESFEITFRKFKDLQKKWFSSGIVPQQNLKDLWDSYHYFVDKFNDYVRINRELRALDLKKNLELKIQLCERTAELDKDPNIVQAFKSLQNYHARWREIGPVPRDNRDEVWDRFKLATSVINRKHQEYHSRLKESLYDNLKRKEELCLKVETIAEKVCESHNAWVENTNLVLEIQKSWKTIGYAPKKDNNAIYARFRKACDTFFGSKASFYAAAFEEQKENLNLKTDITEKAEALGESKDWKVTTTELIRLQKQWKEIGPVPRRESDKLWKRFRAACDTFFNNKSKYFENIDSTFDDNLKAKEALVVEMDAYTSSEVRKKNLEALEEFQAKFNAIGYVPSGKKDWIKEHFRQALDRLLEQVGLNESERSIFKFRNRIMGMMNAPRAEMKLNFERDKLVNKLQQLLSDIGLWENNIGFFKQSDSSEETIQGFHEKIDSAHERIKNMEMKIHILDDMENAN